MFSTILVKLFLFCFFLIVFQCNIYFKHFFDSFVRSVLQLILNLTIEHCNTLRRMNSIKSCSRKKSNNKKCRKRKPQLNKHLNGSCKVSEKKDACLNPFGGIEEITGRYILNFFKYLNIQYSALIFHKPFFPMIRCELSYLNQVLYMTYLFIKLYILF